MFYFPGINPVKDRIIAATGAGGKTHCLEYLAQGLKELGHRVLLTTTTRIVHPGSTGFGQHIDRLIDRNIPESLGIKPAAATLTVAGYPDKASGKLSGLSPALIAALVKEDIYDSILVEADGSRGLPLKVPAGHEPVLPDECQVVIAVTGWKGIRRALNKGIDASQVHRWQRFSRMTGLLDGDHITPAVMGKLLGDNHGLFKNTPASARKIWLVNQVDSERDKSLATEFIQTVTAHSIAIDHCLISCFQDTSQFPVRTVSRTRNLSGRFFKNKSEGV
ncbi:selenium cofactor biosynthesis protein YqeC [Endozoicomonas sp. Mp262]|uniref:selenium cofactor biosynthesis protein YqeC n=1 Tax=Endozoicomonas sp. Mp262 TaxID=2919499 RepID=UPI0021D89A73